MESTFVFFFFLLARLEFREIPLGLNGMGLRISIERRGFYKVMIAVEVNAVGEAMALLPACNTFMIFFVRVYRIQNRKTLSRRVRVMLQSRRLSTNFDAATILVRV